jgi:hypothetical protein
MLFPGWEETAKRRVRIIQGLQLTVTPRSFAVNVMAGLSRSYTAAIEVLNPATGHHVPVRDMVRVFFSS